MVVYLFLEKHPVLSVLCGLPVLTRAFVFFFSPSFRNESLRNRIHCLQIYESRSFFFYFVCGVGLRKEEEGGKKNSRVKKKEKRKTGKYKRDGHCDKTI